jgi:AcrR family transcriptional regulator
MGKASRPLGAAARAALRPGTRREGDRELPAGPKATRTRAALLKAAHDAFVERGYLDTTVAQIAEAAGVSLGTFYQYFKDRADVMVTLMAEHTAAAASRTSAGWKPDQGVESLYGMVHSFVAWYAEQAPFAKVWEEVCQVDEGVAELRRDLGRVFTDSVQRQLVKGARSGQLRRFTPADADLAARALTGMVDRFCYVTYVFDPPTAGPPPPEDAARLLTGLWARAVGLDGEE